MIFKEKEANHRIKLIGMHLEHDSEIEDQLIRCRSTMDEEDGDDYKQLTRYGNHHKRKCEHVQPPRIRLDKVVWRL